MARPVKSKQQDTTETNADAVKAAHEQDPVISEAKDATPSRVEQIFGPLFAGILLDMVDLATFGPLGFYAGMFVGSAAAYYLCRVAKLPRRWRMIGALLGGVYCTLPLTEFLPLGTLLGAFIRYRATAAAR